MRKTVKPNNSAIRLLKRTLLHPCERLTFITHTSRPASCQSICFIQLSVHEKGGFLREFCFFVEMYQLLYTAFLNFHSEKTKKNAQEEVNQLWKQFKADKANFPSNVKRKLVELEAASARKKAGLLNFFARVSFLFRFTPADKAK